MIQISKIDNRLSIYKNKKVFIWGAGKRGQSIYEKLEWFGIYIEGYIDSDIKKIGRKYNDRYIYSIESISNFENVVIQLALPDMYENDVIKKIECYKAIQFIRYREAFVRLVRLSAENLCYLSPEYENEYVNIRKNLNISDHTKFIQYIYRENAELILLCMPQKTGDWTIVHTFEKYDVGHCNIWHNPANIDIEMLKKLEKKVKIITALREPISQNISALYQKFDANANPAYFIHCNEIWENGGDVQKAFDLYLQYERYLSLKCEYKDYYEKYKRIYNSDGYEVMIQKFIPVFEKNIAKIQQCDFDKKKGFGIYKEDNIEIFIFQIEKLNHLIGDLSEWIGHKMENFENFNIGEEKWYAKSYAQAQKELKISQEYFDKCYNEPYVKHFYSDEDIAKFKDKWRGHIV